MKRLPVFFLLAILILGTGFLLFSKQEQAPDISWQNLQGQQQALNEFRGKAVLVNFWATTCTGCMKEMPKLVELERKLGTDSYQTIAIAMQYDDRTAIDNYVQRTQLPFVVVHDDGRIAKAFGDIQLTPTSILIDKEGNLVARYLGEPDMQMLENRIRELI